MKRRFYVFVLGLLCLFCLSIAACGETTKIEKVIEFPRIEGLAETYEGWVGDEFVLPEVKAYLGETQLDVSFEVTDPEAEEVRVENRTFLLASEGEYRIFCSAEGGGKMVRASAKLFADPVTKRPSIVLSSPNQERISLGETIVPAEANAMDDNGNVVQVSVRVSAPDGTPRQEGEAADLLGKYDIIYTAEDRYGNRAVLSEKIFCVASETPLYCENGFEEFSDLAELPMNVNWDVSISRDYRTIASGAGAVRAVRNNSTAGENWSFFTLYTRSDDLLPGKTDVSALEGISFRVFNPSDTAQTFVLKSNKKNWYDASDSVTLASTSVSARGWGRISVQFSDYEGNPNFDSAYTFLNLFPGALTEFYLDELCFEPVEGFGVPAIPETIYFGEQIALPSAANCELTVTTPSGETVEDKFSAEETGYYIAEYSGGGIRETYVLTCLYEPKMTLSDTSKECFAGYAYTLPECDVVFGGKYDSVEIVVEGPDGEQITDFDSEMGSFTPDVKGKYSALYILRYEDAEGATKEKRLVWTIWAETPYLFEDFEERTSVSDLAIGLTNGQAFPGEIKLNISSENAYRGNQSLELVCEKDRSMYIEFKSLLGTRDLRAYGAVTLRLKSEKAVYLGDFSINPGTGSKVVAKYGKQVPAGEWILITLPLSSFTPQERSNLYSIEFYYEGGCSLWIDEVGYTDPEPEILFEGANPEVALLGKTISIATAVAQLNGNPLEVTRIVTGPQNGEITAEGNMITPTEAGIYRVTYRAEYLSLVGTTTVFERSDEIWVKPAGVLNNFEFWDNAPEGIMRDSNASTYSGQISINTEPQFVCEGAQSLKLMIENPNGLTNYFKFPEMIGTRDLTGISKITMKIYVVGPQTYIGQPAIGFETEVVGVGSSARGVIGQWSEITIDLKDAALAGKNLSQVYGLSVYLGQGIYYLDDIRYEEERPEIVLGSELPTTVLQGDVISVPSATAEFRRESVTVTVSVQAPDGSLLDLSDDNFSATQLGEYTVAFSAEYTDLYGYATTYTLSRKVKAITNVLQDFDSWTTADGVRVMQQNGSPLNGSVELNENPAYSDGGAGKSLKIAVNSDQSLYIDFEPLIGTNDFSGFSKITYRVYLETANYFGSESIVDTKTKVSVGSAGAQLSSGKWFTRTLDIEKAKGTDGFRAENVRALLFYIGPVKTIYLDNFKFE